jgi:hypothetical protein
MNSTFVRTRLALVQGVALEHTATTSLMEALGPVDDIRVLLIGPHTLETMCALMRRGCAAVTTLHVGDRTDSSSADLAIISRLASPEAADQALAQARRALVPLSRIVVTLDADDPATLREHVMEGLTRRGFLRTRSWALGDMVVIEAELPLFGRPLAVAACA